MIPVPGQGKCGGNNFKKANTFILMWAIIKVWVQVYSLGRQLLSNSLLLPPEVQPPNAVNLILKEWLRSSSSFIYIKLAFSCILLTIIECKKFRQTDWEAIWLFIRTSRTQFMSSLWKFPGTRWSLWLISWVGTGAWVWSCFIRAVSKSGKLTAWDVLRTIVGSVGGRDNPVEGNDVTNHRCGS